ncbi:hypothetical protein THAOC_07132 [Thalassiosira oceanica]|uniref:Uncharacterized protein n=1 Tax=Thalassiosira oceanica TaxID=159749 RepID=K0T2N3_THAOC|nr:hypothetical protein THAOC_07132 [Thalassiosira oceanica]|eukprot:EJK71429.1 hypothetical protein THAOC_07132 [Thalassiosira oceanica]
MDGLCPLCPPFQRGSGGPTYKQVRLLPLPLLPESRAKKIEDIHPDVRRLGEAPLRNSIIDSTAKHAVPPLPAGSRRHPAPVVPRRRRPGGPRRGDLPSEQQSHVREDRGRRALAIPGQDEGEVGEGDRRDLRGRRGDRGGRRRDREKADPAALPEEHAGDSGRAQDGTVREVAGHAS